MAAFLFTKVDVIAVEPEDLLTVKDTKTFKYLKASKNKLIT